ncbi:MAG TPA: hypothetical protein VMV10_08745 [Pirellulales bacterium]|nr:hypothetical protein [Pirellulales bacterium]
MSAMELQGIEAIDAAMREPVGRYAQRVRSHAGEKALSLTLFGAIAGETFDVAKQTVSSVLVLAEIDLDALRNLAAEGHKFGKTAIAAPLVMTPAFIKASLDSFPLELIEIQQRRVVLFGDDYFDKLQFADDHVRLQCERELKAIAVGIRQRLLASSGRESSFGGVAEQAAAGLARTLRGLVWLHGVKEPRRWHALVAEAEKLLGRPLHGVRRAANPPLPFHWHDLQELYQDVEALGRYADAW